MNRMNIGLWSDLEKGAFGLQKWPLLVSMSDIWPIKELHTLMRKYRLIDYCFVTCT